jgi:thioesterase domain-containing protein
LDRKALPAPGTVTGERRVPYLGPRDLQELMLVQIWEELLEVHPIGVHDDFFSLGGHSLMALRLMARLRARLGRGLPLTALFRSPSVAGLARRLREAAPRERREPLVEIQAGGGGIPVFLVHPVGGDVLCYLDLARELGPGRPIYGLQAPDPEPGKEPLSRIEDLAERYLEAVRRVRPNGPYLLGGWSMGGLVAFDMARQLLLAGEAVAQVVLIDTYAATAPGEPELDLPTRVALFARDLFGLTGLDLPPLDDGVWSLEGEELLRELYDRSVATEILPADLEFAELRRTFDVFSANLNAMYRYAGQPYPGHVALIRAEERAEGQKDPALVWSGLVQDLTVSSSPGNHYSILRQPGVRRLGELVRTLLDPDPSVE